MNMNTENDVYLHLRNRDVFGLHQDWKGMNDNEKNKKPSKYAEVDVDDIYMHLRNRDVFGVHEDLKERNDDKYQHNKKESKHVEFDVDDIYMHLRNRDVFENHRVEEKVRFPKEYSEAIEEDEIYLHLRNRDIIDTIVEHRHQKNRENMTLVNSRLSNVYDTFVDFFDREKHNMVTRMGKKMVE